MLEWTKSDAKDAISSWSLKKIMTIFYFTLYVTIDYRGREGYSIIYDVTCVKMYVWDVI